MKLQVESRAGKHLCSLELDLQKASLADLKAAFEDQCHYYPERQRWTLADGRTPILEGASLAAQGLKDNQVVKFKDLGVQISWRLVFVLEYLGPILIAPFFYFGVHHTYQHPSLTQQIGMWLLILHFVKRELETLFIHRFSHGTMPIIRLPINCAHYWLLCGFAISYYLFHPKYRGPFDNVPIVVYILSAVMLCFEFLNFQTHVVLRNLRPRNSKARAIPHGWGFDLVSCANYFWEVCAWTTFAVLSGCLTSWLFLAVAFAQMTDWALKKHRNYHAEFKNYPRNRKAILPAIL